MRWIPALILSASAAYATPPLIRDVTPHGAQRGKSLTVYLRGEGLVRGARIQSTLPGSFSQLTLTRDPLSNSPGVTARPDSVLAFLVTLKADAATGLYPVRVLTPDGVSNVVLFSVGEFTEVEEIESAQPKRPNNFPAEAQEIKTPVTVNGTLRGPDIDIYKFTARAGQKLVFEVEARRAGSAIDPAIEILDSSGKEIASSEDAPSLGVDARVEASFAKAGEYFVRVHDSKFSEQAQDFYRLKVGSFLYADAIYPLGWKRGEPVEVTLSGGNLPKPVKVKADVSAKGAFVAVRLPDSPSLPMLFSLSDAAESMEPAELSNGVVANGRISKPGEVDRYRVAVKPGEKWVFEVEAASLGVSELDGLLSIYDAKGKKLASADDGNGVDPVLPFTVPAGLTEVTVALEDLLRRGGDRFAYRLKAIKSEPDFVVDLLTPYVNVPAGGTAQVACLIQRRGYDGVIRARIANLPQGFHQAGGHVPSEAAAQLFNNDNAGRRSARTVITITADEGVKQQFLELSVLAEASTPSGLITRKARGPGMVTAVRGDRQKPMTAFWLEMELPMAVSEPPPAVLDVPTPQVRIAQGYEYPMAFKIKRREGARAGRVNTQIAGAVSNIRVNRGEGKQEGDSGSYQLATNFSTPGDTFDMLFETEVEVDGRKVAITSPAIEFHVVQGFAVEYSKTSLDVTPGGSAELTGSVRREPTFEGGEVRVAAEDLPEGVRCPAVLVPAGQRDFTLRCEATAAAAPGTHEIRLTSAAPNVGRKAKSEYKIADVNARLVITRAAAAAGSGNSR